MKKILTAFHSFILIVSIQALYVDYSLNKKISNITNDQYVISNEVEKLAIKTKIMRTKYKKVLLKNRNKSSSFQPILAYTNKTTDNSIDNLLWQEGK